MPPHRRQSRGDDISDAEDCLAGVDLPTALSADWQVGIAYAVANALISCAKSLSEIATNTRRGYFP